jgi:putative transcriptional regulator
MQQKRSGIGRLKDMKATTADYLVHQFLIAMPSQDDENFGGSLVYIAEHNTRGALGLVINKPTDLSVKKLFSRIELSLPDGELDEPQVYAGGPVQTDRGFVLHTPQGQWGSSIQVSEDIALTSSKDVLEAVSNGDGPKQFLISLGYSGWSAGQLEDEIARNAWLTVPASASVIFATASEDRLASAFGLLGVNPLHLANAAGHA